MLMFSLGGCKTKDSTHATVIGTNVYAKGDTAICKGNSVKLEANPGKLFMMPTISLSSVNVKAKSKTRCYYIYTAE
jgi:hypothetical protein